VARSDAYTWAELKRLVKTAQQHGIGVVPIANLLGHTQYLIKCPEWRDLNELRELDGSPAPQGQICPDHPRTPEVAQRLIRDLAPLCTAGKLHVGLDESFHLGRHPESAQRINQHGRAGYFADYVRRLDELVRAQGLQTGIWGDMLILLPDAIPHLPRGIAVYDWYYHGFRQHPRFELYNFAEYNLAPALAAQGIDYWACPMNGAFRHEPLPIFGDRLANAIAWWQRAQRVKAAGYLVTSWEANHLTPEITTAIDAAVAGLWLDDGKPDHAILLRQGLERVGFRSQAATETRLALACDEYAFAGYARAERNSSWDTPPLAEGIKPAAAEARFYARTGQRTGWQPLQRSLQWRAYLAEREQFVRQAAQGVLRARRLLSRNKARDFERKLIELGKLTEAFEMQVESACERADALWVLTRDDPDAGANHQIALADGKRFRQWQDWLAQVAADSAAIWTVSPVVGIWQLALTVHATRPSANMVVVQQQSPDGTWHDLRQRHTIEFRSVAARRRSAIKRAWSVPIDNPDLPLRIALRGVGEVAVSQVSLTNGVEIRVNQSWPRAQRHRLGLPAPEQGWPELDWTQNMAELDLQFQPSS
jgi:hypothetical protein